MLKFLGTKACAYLAVQKHGKGLLIADRFLFTFQKEHFSASCVIFQRISGYHAIEQLEMVFNFLQAAGNIDGTCAQLENVVSVL